MDEDLVSRYWCYMCTQMVNPVIEVEIKCPFCNSGFVEEMSNRSDDDQTDLGSDGTLSSWARILLGMLGSNGQRRRLSRGGEGVDEHDDEVVEAFREEMELERNLELIQRRRRRSSTTILQLLQGHPASGMPSETENSVLELGNENRRERVVLLNPYNQNIMLDVNQGQDPTGTFGDYLVGHGFEFLVQHLSENDPNIHGTPPAQKDAVEAMPTSVIKENLRCSVCLEDFEIGSEAKEMPCKHKFHNGCIHPWLQLHSSCPVCRFQMPSKDEPSIDTNGSGNNRAV